MHTYAVYQGTIIFWPFAVGHFKSLNISLVDCQFDLTPFGSNAVKISYFLEKNLLGINAKSQDMQSIIALNILKNSMHGKMFLLFAIFSKHLTSFVFGMAIFGNSWISISNSIQWLFMTLYLIRKWFMHFYKAFTKLNF